MGAVRQGPDAVRRALPGLRVSLLVGTIGGGLAVLMWGIGMLLTGTRLTALAQLLLSVLNPIGYVLMSPFEHLISYLHAHSHPLKLSTPPTKVMPTSPKALSALGHSTHVVLIVGGILLILAVAIGTVLAARRRREELGPDNRPASPLDILFETISGATRVRLDLGQGARRVVRAAVWRHLLRAHRGKLLSSATARRLASQEGWTDDSLQTYERARYRLRQNFDASIARRFLQTFRPHRDKKDQT